MIRTPKQEVGKIGLIIKLLEFMLIKEPAGLVADYMSSEALNFFFGYIQDTYMQDFLLKILTSTDVYKPHFLTLLASSDSTTSSRLIYSSDWRNTISSV